MLRSDFVDRLGCIAAFMQSVLYNGLGTHIVFVPPHELVVYMKTLSTGSFTYTLCIAFVKLSILAFYKRLFPVKPMVLAVNIVGSVVILWAYGVCLVGALTCIPFRKLWDPTIPGGCIDLPKFYYGLQIPNIVTDAIILGMPMKVVWNLHVPRTQKVALSGIFLLGFLCETPSLVLLDFSLIFARTLIFDIIRLVAMVELSEAGNDITYAQTQPSVWTCIEPAVGITAACLSNMRPLFKFLPKMPNISWPRSLTLSLSGDTFRRKSLSGKHIRTTTVVKVHSRNGSKSASSD
ncbi:uncharacterized protein KD926_000065 [Aspergillus affinis]|uniref:uncharacterized protein n=1 Tax=Aspergillus affinis TaxID=1070780 RepID=UPI0022FDFD87|nr:uncharacterized protein KD926_000065 [Aspergillus affinis]KAI9037724.1 hypothetical protein KD926_000065 [Aspergillus affinis]